MDREHNGCIWFVHTGVKWEEFDAWSKYRLNQRTKMTQNENWHSLVDAVRWRYLLGHARWTSLECVFEHKNPRVVFRVLDLTICQKQKCCSNRPSRTVRCHKHTRGKGDSDGLGKRCIWTPEYDNCTKSIRHQNTQRKSLLKKWKLPAKHWLEIRALHQITCPLTLT